MLETRLLYLPPPPTIRNYISARFFGTWSSLPTDQVEGRRINDTITYSYILGFSSTASQTIQEREV